MEKKVKRRRTKVTAIRWYPEEFARVEATADMLRKDVAVYMRDLALANASRAPRNLSEDARKQIAEATMLLNEAGSPLRQLAEDVAIGDFPVSISVPDTMAKTVMASRLIRAALAELLAAGDDLLKAGK